MAGSDLNDMASDSALPGHDQSPLLAQAGFRHAFFTRAGGASEGPFESLSFSTAVGDDPRHVEENLTRASTLLGVDSARILYLSQVHGRDARFYRTTEERSHLITLEGDALGGTRADNAYAVRTADCVPLLLADRTTGAVMAIHAGWRGIVLGVVEEAVACLRRNLGAAGQLLAAIGPHISADAFEVSEEVANALQAACPGARAAAVERLAGRPKPHVNLRHIVTQKLLTLGLTAGVIDQVGGCTLLDATRYFSFRRDGKRSGRHLSAIVPRG